MKFWATILSLSALAFAAEQTVEAVEATEVEQDRGYGRGRGGYDRGHRGYDHGRRDWDHGRRYDHGRRDWDHGRRDYRGRW